MGYSFGMGSTRDVQEHDFSPRWDEQERVRYASGVGAARRAFGLTQAQLADRANVSRGTIMNIERGDTIPQASVLWRVLEALDALPTMEQEWSPEVEGWLRLIAPLIEQMRESVRERVMLGVVQTISDAVTSQATEERATVHELRRPDARVSGESDTEDRVIAAMDDYPGEDQQAEIEGHEEMP